MEARDLLQTLAEIAIAVAGFDSIAAVFASKDRQTSPQIVMRFEAMLAYSFCTAVASLLPLIPQQYGASVTASWQIAAVLYAVLTTAVNLALIKRFVGRGTTSSLGFAAVAALVSWSPVVLIAFSLLDLGTLSGNYVVALVLVLSQGFWMFLRVVSALFAEFPEK